jgi:phosphoserine aminotransferase
MARIYNFGAGPAALPLPVLEKAREEMIDYAGSGMSIMEMSHRSKTFDAVIRDAEANIRKIFSVPDTHAVLFLQGGASLQFGMAPANLLRADQTADIVHTGSWASKAIKEAKLYGKVNLAWDGKSEKYMRIPEEKELKLTPGAAYVHVTSNETIEGIQYKTFPKTEAPLLADMSSDIMSRPIDVSQFGLIYAGAQKNLGPSGMALVIIRKDLAARVPDHTTTMMKYSTHIENQSLYNTPNTWAIYIFKLVTEWVEQQGGMAGVQRHNEQKAKVLYDELDRSSYWKPCAQRNSRSLMNVTWRMGNEALEEKFAKEATKAGFDGLKGHRSVGGLRASIYNAMSMEGIQSLVGFMKDFEKKNG